MADPRPKWQQVYDQVSDLIARGKLVEGDHIPTEHELSDLFECTRGPVRQAINKLEHHGLVERQAGATPTVRRHQMFRWDITRHENPRFRLDDPDAGRDDWAADIVAQGMTPHQVVSVRGMVAPDSIAQLLQLPEGARVVRRRRVRSASNLPVCVSDSWFTEEDAQRWVDIDGERYQPVYAEQDVVIKGGFVAAMGLKQVQFINTFRANQPTAELERLLALPSAGASILYWVRIGVDDTGRRVRAIEHHCAGSRVEIEFTQFLEQEGCEQ